MIFCNFCDCDNCRNGAEWLSHAELSDGRWICDVCYLYEVCLDGGSVHPCRSDLKCEHRPSLKSGEWYKK